MTAWAAASLLALAQAGDLRVGEPATGSLPPEAEYRFVAPSSGTYSFSAESWDFDVRLTAGEDRVDEDSGVETNALLVVDLAEGEPLTLTVGGRGTGEFRVTVEAGAVAPLQGAELARAGIEFRRVAAERAEQRADLRGVVFHLTARGYLLNSQGGWDEADSDFARAIAVARENDWPALLADALKGRGNTAMRRNDLEASLGYQEEAGEIFAALGDRGGQVKTLGNIANVYRKQGRKEEARELLREQLGLAEELGDEWTVATALIGLGQLHNEDYEPARAHPLIERALEISERLGQPQGRAICQHELARAALHLERFDEALEMARQARSSLEFLGASWAASQVMTLEAQAACGAGDYEHAFALAEEAAGIAERFGHDWGRLWALQMRGLALSGLGRNPLSLAAYREAEEVATRLGARQAIAWVKWGQGRAQMNLGRYSEARRMLEESRELARELGDTYLHLECEALLAEIHHLVGHTDAASESATWVEEEATRIGKELTVASARLHQGRLAAEQGRFGQAEQQIEQALSAYRRAGSRDGALRCGIALADLAILRSDFFRAVELARELVKRAEELALPLLVDRTRSTLANALHYLGRLEESREVYEQVLAGARARGDRLAAADALDGLGDLYIHFGISHAAVQTLLDGLEDARAGGLKQRELTLNASLGRAYTQSQQLEEAEASTRRALALADELGRPKEGLLTNLGTVLIHQGRLDEAEVALRERLEEAERIGQPVGRAHALYGLAWIASERGDLERSEALAQECSEALAGASQTGLAVRAQTLLAVLALQRGNLDQVARLLEGAEGLIEGSLSHRMPIAEAAYLRSRFSLWSELAQDLCARRLAGCEDPKERRAALAEGFQAASKWKGRSLLDGIVERRRGLRSSEVIALRREQRDLLANRDAVLERILMETPSPEEYERLLQRAESLRRQADEVAAEIRARAPADARLTDPRPASIDEVQALLPADAALVELVEGKDRLYAFVLTRERAHHVELATRDRIEAALADFLDLVADTRAPGSLEEIAVKGRELHDALLAPALAVLEEPPAKLVLVPTLSLAGLPFEALVTAARPEPRTFADLEHVIDAFEVSYAPSSSVLVELTQQAGRQAGGRVLVLADPRYPGEGGAEPQLSEASSSLLQSLKRSSPGPETFVRIENTRVEALAIADLLMSFEEDLPATKAAEAVRLREERSGSLSTELFDLHLGRAASPERLRGDLTQYSILHVAAHGYVDHSEPRNSGLALSFDERHPGWFTVADALELELNAELVVLSACDTARGAARKGDGVQSMARAFLYSGARAVVASLWQVDDRSSAQTMRAFYRKALSQGLPPARALHEAKLELRRASSRGRPLGQAVGAAPRDGHPCYWAPFIYVGLPE